MHLSKLKPSQVDSNKRPKASFGAGGEGTFCIFIFELLLLQLLHFLRVGVTAWLQLLVRMVAYNFCCGFESRPSPISISCFITFNNNNNNNNNNT